LVQPGGLEPDAENIHNLPGGRGYYHLQIAANKHRPGYVDRMIHNKPVPMQFGQPVNPGFSYSEHVRSLEFDPRFRLIVAMDQGLFAAAVALQRDGDGRAADAARAGVHARGRQGAREDRPDRVRPGGQGDAGQNFPDLGATRSASCAIRRRSRPAIASTTRWTGSARSRRCSARRSTAPRSNSPQLRNEAIWQAMDKRGGYAVDPSCKHLIRAHLGGYHYRKAEIAANVSGAELRGHLEIADTIYTHVADAEQYGALEGEHVVADAARPRPAQPAADRQRQPIRRPGELPMKFGQIPFSPILDRSAIFGGGKKSAPQTQVQPAPLPTRDDATTRRSREDSTSRAAAAAPPTWSPVPTAPRGRRAPRRRSGRKSPFPNFKTEKMNMAE
jgi:hypothetical protein